jgi:hypothetical protein
VQAPRRDRSALAAVHSSRELGSNADHLARSNDCDSRQGCRHQGTKVFKRGAGRDEDNDTEAGAGQILLKLEILVGGDETSNPLSAARRSSSPLVSPVQPSCCTVRT